MAQVTKIRDEIVKLINVNEPDTDLPKKLKRLGKKLVKLLELSEFSKNQNHNHNHTGGSIIDSEDLAENYDKYVKYKTKYLILKRNDV